MVNEEAAYVESSIFHENAITSIPEGMTIRVTDRSFNEVAGECNFTTNTVKKLPPNSVLVDVGCGTEQTFLRQALKINPNIIPCGIDLSLAISPTEISEGRVVISRHASTFGGDIVDYFMRENKHRLESDVGILPIEEAVKFHEHRREIAAKVNTTVMHLPELALSSGSVSMLVDCNGPIEYIPDFDGKLEYLEEIFRVLKAGGKAYLFPLSYHDTFLRFNDDDALGVSIEDTFEFGFAERLRRKHPDAIVTVRRVFREYKKYYNLGMVIEKGLAHDPRFLAKSWLSRRGF